jgi:beta-lactamase class A
MPSALIYRRRGLVSLAAAAALLGTGALSAHPARAEQRGVAEELRRTMDELRFEEVLDLAPPSTVGALSGNQVDKEAAVPRTYAVAAPEPISQQPQLDATVIELDGHNRPVASGTVLMSPQYPDGKIVPVDRNFHTTAVRWRQWDDAGWYANRAQGTIDVVPGRENAPLDFMLPYPASVLKLMVTFGVLRLVDRGEIALDDTYDYRPTTLSPLCGDPSSDTIRNYVDASITWSSNAATCALVKMLHDRGAVAELNQTFQDLGLETLQLKDTNPVNGGRWSNPVTMSSLDTAKLLTLVNGAPGKVWRTPDGRPVTRAVLSASSRAFFMSTLAQQGLNEVLSTTNYCGAGYPAPGIPQRTPSRWIGQDGTVTVQGAAYGHDVRPCDQRAEVIFAHKTGLVSNSGGDAGVVTSLPGKAPRRYIIVVLSNLGTQYQDPGRPPTPPGTHPVSYTQKYAQLGNLIDRYMQRRAGG